MRVYTRASGLSATSDGAGRVKTLKAAMSAAERESVELQDIRLDSEAEPEPDGEVSGPRLHSELVQLVASCPQASEMPAGEREGGEEGGGRVEEERAGLRPETFSLVEAAQYGNLERSAVRHCC